MKVDIEKWKGRYQWFDSLLTSPAFNADTDQLFWTIVSWSMIKLLNIPVVPELGSTVKLRRVAVYSRTGEIVYAYTDPKSIVACVVIRNLKDNSNLVTRTTATEQTANNEEEKEKEKDEDEEEEEQEPNNNNNHQDALPL